MMNPNRNIAQCSFNPRPDALESCFWLLRFLRKDHFLSQRNEHHYILKMFVCLIRYLKCSGALLCLSDIIKCKKPTLSAEQ